MSAAQLSSKAVLAYFSVSRWGRRCFDAKATDDVARTNDAQSGTGSYTKELLPKGATTKLDAVTYSARNYHRVRTLPWMDDGVRILPAALYLEYAAQMSEYRKQFEEEVAAFLKEYPGYVEKAKPMLGKLYNATNYPSVDSLKKSYDFGLTILPFPSKEDFRVEQIDLQEAKSELAKRMDTVWQGALSNTAERVTDVVGKLSERLKAYTPGKNGKRAENTFRDSLVDNVKELVDLLPSFNLTGDKKLAKIIDQMQKELCKYDADLLRDDDQKRKKVATSADAILASIADFIA